MTQRVLQDITTRKALARGAREFAEVAAYETGIEVLQQEIEVVGLEIGQIMSDLPVISGSKVFDELVTTAYTTALGMGVVGLPGAAVTTVTELDRVERAKQAQTFLSALGSSAEAVELRTQVPEQFQELLQRQVSEYGPVQDIGIPVDRFIAYWQERNVDPRVVAQEILGDTTAYDQAVEQGTADVVIPLANFVAKVAGTEHYAGLLPDVRLRPDDLTGREAEAQESKLREDIEAMRAEVEQVAQAETLEGDADRVLDDVTAKITATGVYTADQVATMARSIAAPYIVMAKRSGQSPWQLYSSRNINVLEPVRAEKLYDAIVEMEEAMKIDPSSPESLAAIERVNVLRGELEELPGGREVAARALTPMVMPASAVEVGQRVVLPDGRSAVVVEKEAVDKAAIDKRISRLRNRIENLQATLDRQSLPVQGTPEAEGAVLTIPRRLSDEELAKLQADLKQAKADLKAARSGAGVSVRIAGETELVDADTDVQVPGVILEQARIVLSHEQRLQDRAPVRAPRGNTYMGVLEKYTVENPNTDAPALQRNAPLIQASTNANNADVQSAALDALFAAHPDPLSSVEAWVNLANDAFSLNRVPMPPFRTIEIVQNGARIIQQEIEKLSEGMRRDAEEGLATAREFGQLYSSGRVTPDITAKAFLWSFLSRGVSPYVQESAFLDAIVSKELTDIMREAVKTGWNKELDARYTKWAESA
ncbi:MAG: hypothetical protein ACO280_13315, partial [Pseudohongiellaceae bacterium]